MPRLAPTPPDPLTVMQLETEVWREACKHTAIDEFVESIAPLMGASLGIDLVLVRRLDMHASRLQTVAVHALGEAREPEHATTNATPRALEELLAWSRVGATMPGNARLRVAPATLTVPDGVSGTYVAGPLRVGDETVGVLVLVRLGGEAFDDTQCARAGRLLEPFAVALENDRRIHETARLREAAEADRRALLTRLDRQEISDAIVGAADGLRAVMARVEQVAPTDASVLILGETGSGKEVLARAIHERSRRASGPVVRVNCGAIPPELVDSELFGHERGSFTGATGTRKGWFERADGGTLFLDEIGELPLAAQVRLLRVLQEGTLERIGSHRSISVDVRIVAATHRDLALMVERGEFREDLWYRISVFPIHLPGLRDRREDIPSLAAHFAAKAGIRLGGAPLSPSAEDLHLLIEYDWPGNVRELASVIERAAILGNGRRLEVRAALGGSNNREREPTAPQRITTRPIPQRTDGPFPTLDEAMVEHIARALERTRGTIEGPDGAASLLGINPHTLRSRMRKHGLDWARFRGRAPSESEHERP